MNFFKKIFLLSFYIFSVYSAEVSTTSIRYSERQVSLDGRVNFWNINLYPNGRFVWQGNHLGSKEGCSQEAGEIIQNVNASRASELAKIAYNSVKVQKSLNKNIEIKNLQKADQENGASLGVEFNNEYLLSRIENLHDKELIHFKQSVIKLLDDLLLQKFSKARVVKMTHMVGKDYIKVKLSNTGALPIRMSSSKSELSFFLRVSNKNIPLKILKMKKGEFDKVIKKGASLEITLELPAKIDTKNAILYFQNNTKSLPNKNAKAINVALCEKLQ